MKQTTSEPSSTTPPLDPNGWYKPREFAQAIRSGPRPIYRAIRTGKLRAAPINDRGDLRIRGAWGLDWLESEAAAR